MLDGLIRVLGILFAFTATHYTRISAPMYYGIGAIFAQKFR